MMASPHPAALPGKQLLAECDTARQRRSGPGGQHRNKVETAVRLVHRPTGITAEASERRSQAANLAMATRRLRLKLALDVRREPAEAPSGMWTSRCRGGVIALSSEHEDFPTLLAEALDQLQGGEWNLRVAAQKLACTASQLTKLLRKHPPALALLNRHRQQRGAAPLR